jgi:hypothetical protein
MKLLVFKGGIVLIKIGSVPNVFVLNTGALVLTLILEPVKN